MKAISIAAILLITFAACKKKDCNCVPPPVTPNTWNHDSVRYEAGSSNWYISTRYTMLSFSKLGGTADNDASISFNFTRRPVTGGTFKITGSPLADNEIGIIAAEAHRAGFGSLPREGQTADVKVDSNGKLSLYCNGVIMKELLFVGGDSTYFSFNLTEF